MEVDPVICGESEDDQTPMTELPVELYKRKGLQEQGLGAPLEGEERSLCEFSVDGMEMELISEVECFGALDLCQMNRNRVQIKQNVVGKMVTGRVVIDVGNML